MKMASIKWPYCYFHTINSCLFVLFTECSRQEQWSGLPFPSPVDHVLSELSTMTCPSWVALHGMAHSFIELDKAVFHVTVLISFLWLWFSFCLPSKEKRLMKGSWWERLTVRESGFCLMGGAMLSKPFPLVSIYLFFMPVSLFLLCQ